MFERIIRFAIEHRWLVLLAVLGWPATVSLVTKTAD